MESKDNESSVISWCMKVVEIRRIGTISCFPVGNVFRVTFISCYYNSVCMGNKLQMFKVGILTAFLALAALSMAADRKIVCYYGRWSIYRPGLGKFDISDIDPSLCTHIIYSFVGLSTSGEVQTLDSWADFSDGLDGFGKLTRLGQRNPSLKVMIAIGGWNEGSQKYSDVVSNPSLRANFVRSAVNFVQKYNFDGFDVDWEYPNQRGGKSSDKDNFVALLRELRQEFDKHGYLLSIAVAAAETSASLSYKISQISQYVHFINLMAYDYNGSWNKYTGLNTPLYPASFETGNQRLLNVDSSVRYWLSQGASANKLILGTASYGRSFTLQNANNAGIGAPATGPGSPGPYTREAGTLGYNEICENIRNGWKVVRNTEQRAPYAVRGNQWVGYDDVTSIEEKANYIISKGLGGAMMWSIETDDFQGTCGQNYPLLRALNRVLNNNFPESKPSTKPPVIKPSTVPPNPSGSVCTHEGFVRDPKNCEIFYYCQREGIGYKIFKYQCSSGLAFDPSINGCNYKNLVSGC